MADINVQRKGHSVWPWILGLLVVALLIWALMRLVGGDDAGARLVEPASEVGPNPEATPPVDAPNSPAGAAQ
ncbi:MAG TPA: hypothetical protein VF167_15600 [Longimicrobiaceae bacterium]